MAERAALRYRAEPSGGRASKFLAALVCSEDHGVMHLLNLPAAHALPWDCPPISEPADAWPAYVDQGDFARAVAGEIQAALEEWDDGSCPEIDCSTDTLTCVEESCTTAAGASWYSHRSNSLSTDDRFAPEVTVQSWEVSPPDGIAAWSHATLTLTTSHTWWYDGESGGDATEAAWAGALRDGLPSDAWLVATSDFYSTESVWHEWSWSSARCSWRAFEYMQEPSLASVGGVAVAVTHGQCDEAPELMAATVAGLPAGLVTPDGWVKVAESCDELGPVDTGSGGTGTRDLGAGETGSRDPGGACGCAEVRTGPGVTILAAAVAGLWRRRTATTPQPRPAEPNPPRT